MSKDGRADLVKRDDDGLMPIQKDLVEGLAESGDLKAACEALEISTKRVRRWMREDRLFRAYYEQAFGSSSLEVVRLQGQLSSEKAMDTLDELTEAQKPVTKSYNCTGCGLRNTVQFLITDASTRRAASETILKASGALKNISEVKIQHEDINLTQWQAVCLMKLRKGLHVSARMLDELRHEGALTQRDEDFVSAIEGQFRVVVEGDEPDEDGTSNEQHDSGAGVE